MTFSHDSTKRITQHTIKTSDARPINGNTHIHRHSMIKEFLVLTSTPAQPSIQLMYNYKTIKKQIQEIATQHNLETNVAQVKNILPNCTLTQQKQQLTILDNRN